eukprot:gnl/TRDRNA2_/TRDRNA2_90681_c0_seq1.p2 gnl/TRDRNA2_/TRDRNA2_90681_c0~~gnl/TRDRNA2_/TRDRNA2_90681_c0_seq1.p2  ORF type:complete len:211 (+),score=32.92 gnl/TRDRNA2_/TRDRNA2_90681_c0_seq1:254-886(+)
MLPCHLRRPACRSSTRGFRAAVSWSAGRAASLAAFRRILARATSRGIGGCEVEVLPARDAEGNLASGAWEVRLRPISPATAVLFTRDGSLPWQRNNAAAKRAPASGVMLNAGGSIFATAVGPVGSYLRASDIVTVIAPRAAAMAAAAPPTGTVGSATTPAVTATVAKAAAPADPQQQQQQKPKAPSAKAKAPSSFKAGLLLGGDDSDDSE